MHRVFLVDRSDVDATTGRELRERMLAFVRDGGDVIIDLSAVEFLDSSGLGTLVAARNAAGECGGTVRLIGARPRVQRALDITGLTHLFPGSH